MHESLQVQCIDVIAVTHDNDIQAKYTSTCSDSCTHVRPPLRYTRGEHQGWSELATEIWETLNIWDRKDLSIIIPLDG